MVCPVKELTALCKERGILVMVDGAHAIGHVDVDVTSIGCDFYTTNCHKWLFAPKGAALLYVARKHHSWIHAPVTSHDWKEDLHSRFATQGTRDFSSLVASRAALRFFQRISAARVRGYCRELREWAGRR
jgi:isopenicillin-N epimerase